MSRGENGSDHISDVPASRSRAASTRDRFDRRFVIEGDPIEALTAVLEDNSGKLF